MKFMIFTILLAVKWVFDLQEFWQLRSVEMNGLTITLKHFPLEAPILWILGWWIYSMVKKIEVMK